MVFKEPTFFEKVNLTKEYHPNQGKLTSRSWVMLDGLSPRKSLELKGQLINAFSQKGDLVFDPFLTQGESLFACHNLKRNGISMTTNNVWRSDVEGKLKKLESQLQLGQFGAKQTSKQLILDSSLKDLSYVWQQYSLPGLDLVISFLPSLPTLQRIAKELYPGQDVTMLDFLEKTFVKLKEHVKSGSYLIFLVANEKHKGTYFQFAWDFAAMMKKHYKFYGEKVVCLESSAGLEDLTDMSMNHKYLLMFRKMEL